MTWSTAIGIIGPLGLTTLVVFLIYRLVMKTVDLAKQVGVEARRADQAELLTKKVVAERDELHTANQTALGEKQLVLDQLTKVTAALVRLQDQIKEKKLEEIDHASLDELRALSLSVLGGVRVQPVPVVPNVPEATNPDSTKASGGDPAPAGVPVP